MKRNDLINELDGTEIAVVGMACHLPGANDADIFWDNLKNGKESITFFSDEELLEAGIPPEQLHRGDYVKAKGKLEGVANFDAGFFGFSPKDAAIMDPQHRHFLECAWEALEVAGYDAERYEGSIGVFAGVGMNTYFIHNLMTNPDLIRSHGMFAIRHTSNDKDFLATRVSYNMNLRGPSVSVQTACSTSLVAIHMSCQSLLNGESDMVLAGGATFDLPQDAGYHYKEGEILSHDGHCRAFDADSTGTVLGNGVGVVVLKRLEDAIQDGDTVHAMVRASAINNDGSLKVSYLAPSVEGQAAVYTEAYAVGDINPETISYVEAHGTGTLVGDPIEVTALTQAFRMYTEKKNFCGLGSVKSNIGHLDTAAGVAAFIKVVMALKHRQIPPSLNFRRPNPALQLEESPFYIVDSLKEWEKGDTPRRAAVSSLGVGGTNAHVVVEESPELPPSKQVRDWQLFVLSARSRQAVDQAASNLSQFLQKNDPILDDVAYTLAVGRKQFKHRRVVVARNREQAIEFLENNDKNHTFYRQLNTDQRPGVVFMFPGGGAQYANMGRELYDAEPIYRDVIDTCLGFYQRNEGSDLRHILFPDEEKTAYATEQMASPSLALPALFMTEYALAKLWMSYGIEPIAMTGHSMGEYTAACIAGVMTIEEALMLVTLRGKLFETLPKGSMLSVMLSEEKLLPLLGSELSIAAINAPELCVASGPDTAIDALQLKLEEEEIDCRRIHISVAAHSSMVEDILEEFGKTVRTLKFKKPRRPFLSNVSGTWITDQQAIDPEYWVQHIRMPVRFAEGLGTLLKDHHCVLLEVGPGKGLGSLAQMHDQIDKNTGIVTSLRHPKEVVADTAFFVRSIGQIWANGVTIDWTTLYQPEDRYRIPLPTYPFEHQRYWIEPGTAITTPATRSEDEPLVKIGDISDWLYQPAWKQEGLQKSERKKDAPRTYLVFKDMLGYADNVCEALKSQNHRVIGVSSGKSFSVPVDDEIILNIRSSGDYELLVAYLSDKDARPDEILHFLSVNHDSRKQSGMAFLDKHLNKGFYSLFYLSRTLANEDWLDEAVSLTVFSNAMHHVATENYLSPEKATILGACRVIALEYPVAHVKSIDLDIHYPGQRGLLARLLSKRKKLDTSFILKEILSTSDDEVVAYREGKRWIRKYEPLPDQQEIQKNSSLKEKGVYVITGGLGGIGLTVAEHLAQSVRARLVLLSRSKFPPRNEWPIWLKSKSKDSRIRQQIQRILLLEKEGSEVIVLTCDVMKPADVRNMTTHVKETYGEINGLFHAAGVIRDSLIQLKTEDEVEQVFGPKITGTLVLSRLLSREKLDFMVLFSSTSSFMASAGQIDYAASNAFLNAYADYANAVLGVRTIAINWGMWQQVGMAAEIAAQLGMKGSTSHPEKNTEVIHPLLSNRLIHSDREALFSTEMDPGEDWVLDEHRLKTGRAILPGTAYIEFVAASWLAEKPFSPFTIEDLFFLNPLHVAEIGTTEVQVGLESKSSEWQCTIRSSQPDQTGAGTLWVEHATATLKPLTSAPLNGPTLDEVKSRCALKTRKFNKSSRELRQSQYLNFGPRWDCLQEVSYGRREIMGCLNLSETYEADLNEYHLHPALLDMATGLGLLLLEEINEDTQSFFVPLSYRRIDVLNTLPSVFNSYVSFSEKKQPNLEAPCFDIQCFSDEGEVVLTIKDFTMRRVSSTAFAASTGDASLGNSNGNGVMNRISDEEPTLLEIGMREGILPDEGKEVLSRILGLQSSQIVASSLSLSALERFIKKQSSGTTDPELGFQASRPNLSSEFVEPATPLEKELVGYWQNLIGIDKIGVHDDFFELGGHSLIALRFFSKLKKAHGVDLSLAILFEYPTIAAFARMLSEEAGINLNETKKERSGQKNLTRLNWKREWSSLVPIQPNGSEIPIFCVHAVFGNVLNYYALSKYLGKDRPFYGLQAQGTDGKKMPIEDYTEMAGLYIKAIKSVQPHGPYIIGGYSLGGEVAYEMAQQLKKAGEEVKWVILFDTLEPGFARDSQRKDRIDEIRNDAAEEVEFFRGEKKKTGRMKQNITRFLKQNKWFTNMLARLLLRSGTTLNPLIQKILMMHAHMSGLQDYSPEKYEGDVLLFRAAETAEFVREKKWMLWEDLVRGGLKTIVVEGHHGLFKEPYVALLARALQNELAEYQKTTS